MVVTLDGMVNEVKPEQFLNAFLPIDVTDDGRVIDSKCVKSQNRLLGMIVTSPPMVTVNKDAVEALNTAAEKSEHDIALYETFAREVHPKKAW